MFCECVCGFYRSIVNGLRDDDAESAYGDRASFTSEYSQNEAVKVFFKEHGRKSSKGSATSFLSRKKNPRPETKVSWEIGLPSLSLHCADL